MIEVVRVGNRSSVTVVRVAGVSAPGAVVVPVSSGTGARDGERWWQGQGPPPDLIVGSRPGDWYWNTITGDVYELTEGT